MRGSALVLMTAMALAAPVMAGPGNGKGDRDERPHGASRDGAAVQVDIRIGGDSRRIIEEYYYSRSNNCPPGLAKKHNGCLPPGQAKKRYQVGGAWDGNPRDYRLPPDLRRRLPPPPAGHYYAYVDDDVLLVAEATHRVVDAVVAVDAAVNGLKR